LGTCQPIDVSWARAFKTLLRDWLRSDNQRTGAPIDPERSACHSGAGQAQPTRARLVFSVIDAARQATTMGLFMAAFRVCGIRPYGPAPVLASRYIRRGEQDAELEDRAANPQRLWTGSQIPTSPSTRVSELPAITRCRSRGGCGGGCGPGRVSA
jgi:hypothetical protein